jgi:ketosteroid isomerase-like protein
MSENDNIARIVKIYEAFGRGDVGYILAQLTSDVHWVSHFEPIVPWGGDLSGKVGKFFAAIAESGEVLSFTPKEFVAQGDTVVSLGEFGYKVRATGKSTLTPWVFIFKLREGKIYSYEQFHDPAFANAFRH